MYDLHLINHLKDCFLIAKFFKNLQPSKNILTCFLQKMKKCNENCWLLYLRKWMKNQSLLILRSKWAFQASSIFENMIQVIVNVAIFPIFFCSMLSLLLNFWTKSIGFDFLFIVIMMMIYIFYHFKLFMGFKSIKHMYNDYSHKEVARASRIGLRSSGLSHCI